MGRSSGRDEKTRLGAGCTDGLLPSASWGEVQPHQTPKGNRKLPNSLLLTFSLLKFCPHTKKKKILKEKKRKQKAAVTCRITPNLLRVLEGEGLEDINAL